MKGSNLNFKSQVRLSLMLGFGEYFEVVFLRMISPYLLLRELYE